MKRGSGVLLHISSLPGPYGIGSMGKAAYDFIDSLENAGQSYWQILPCSPTGYGDSPYQGISAFAGNPYFIDLDLLLEEGLLSKRDLSKISVSEDDSSVDYEAQFTYRFDILKKAYLNGKDEYLKEFSEFKYQNSDWLFDYSLFLVFKRHFAGKQFDLWDREIRDREPAAVMKLSMKYAEDLEAVCFAQFLYEKQWMDLKSYANSKGIKIIGDIPIYVSSDSAEAWASPWLFINDGSVAGCPPDDFAEDGQLWGNPLYDWDKMRENGFSWWIRRIGHCIRLYDFVRLDHFRGLESYFAIPKGGEPKDGVWKKGPGKDLIDALKNAYGELPIIAEDLGFLTQDVFALLHYCGFAGTKVLQFAFDSDNSIYLPHNYDRNCVCYTGTHDNNTSRGWFSDLSKEGRARLRSYMGTQITSVNVAGKLIRAAMMSVSNVCILPMQDILNLGKEARMNVPSKAMGNWQWRMRKGEFDEEKIAALLEMTTVYGRR